MILPKLLIVLFVLYLGSELASGNIFHFIDKHKRNFEVEPYKSFENEFEIALTMNESSVLRKNHAARMKMFTNMTANPCEDFYNFACVNYNEYVKESNIWNERQLAESVFIRLLQNLLKTERETSKAKAFYDFCVGVTTQREDPNMFMTDIWAHADELFYGGIPLIYRTRSTKDGYQITLKEPLKVSENSIREAFQQFHTELQQDDQSWKDIFAFQQKLWEIYDSLDRSDTHRYKVEELNDFYPALDLGRVINYTNPTGKPIDEVTIYGVEAFKALEQLLTKATVDTMFQHIFLEMSTYAADIGVSLTQDSTEQKEYACAALVSNYMNHEAAEIFGKKYYPRVINDAARDILSVIHDVSSENIHNSKFFDDRSLPEAIGKLVNLKIILAYPELDSSIKGVVDRNNDRFQVIPQSTLATFMVLSTLKMRNSRLNDDKLRLWEAHNPFSTNIVISPETGVIAAFLGSLLYPFFDMHLPYFHKFGVFGSEFTTQVMHLYDNNSIHYDAMHNRREWLSPEQEKQRMKMIDCFLNENPLYSTHYAALTLNENLAESVGLRIAFDAYKMWFSAEGKDEEEMDGYSELGLDKNQMFFLSKAQTYCDAGSIGAKEKIYALFAHSQEFSEAFQCPVGSPMNPEVKCTYIF